MRTPVASRQTRSLWGKLSAIPPPGALRACQPLMDVFSLDLFLRLACGLGVGAVIGLDRNLHGKAAGMRTLGLVSLGAAAAVSIVAIHGQPADALSRVLQGLLTGIGFLGVGVIARHGVHDRPQGLTTAAAIWVAAILGAASGAGYYALVGSALGLTILLLLIGGRLESRLGKMLGTNKPGGSPKPD